MIATAEVLPATYSAGTTPGARHVAPCFVQCLCHPHRLMMVAVQTDLQQVLQVALELPDPLLDVLIWHQCIRRVGEPATAQH